MGMRQFFFFVSKKMKISGFKKGLFFSISSLSYFNVPTNSALQGNCWNMQAKQTTCAAQRKPKGL
jgi:hypothetical protein